MCLNRYVSTLQQMSGSSTMTLTSGAAWMKSQTVCFKMTATKAVRTHQCRWSLAPPHISCRCSTRTMFFLLRCHRHHRVTRRPSHFHQPALPNVSRKYQLHRISLHCCVALVRRLMNKRCQGCRLHQTSLRCFRVHCLLPISNCHRHLLSLLLYVCFLSLIHI